MEDVEASVKKLHAEAGYAVAKSATDEKKRDLYEHLGARFAACRPNRRGHGQTVRVIGR
ncbi:hypothetical protein ACVIHI_008099 [Bradyrhizobium sp. USDA 4524]|nr:hypothetical protein [Bradyrhizobium sp. USDA 4538]MCP1899549.1 hypothetical protein [Bradyrhizobium sp. USDA 4537]MCP1986342.1 hypothetical protein [Bradyrhizobium sp. USDA 4539]